MRRTLKMGLVGPGFIAAHHLDAVRRLGDVEIVGIAGSCVESARRRATELGVGVAFASLAELLDADIDVVHNTTPSYVHHESSMAILRAGKHLISDKPLASTPAQCAEIRDAAEAANVRGAVTFNYRGHAMVQHARALVARGELGSLSYIHGHYLQDWMTDENVFSWRNDPRVSGPSSALADIGAHWCDLAEHISGATATHVLADLHTVIPIRYSSGASAGTFTKGNGGQRTPVRVTGEDLATVILRFSNGASGSLRVGQVLPGHKNDLLMELNGRIASLRWEQEKPNELWLGNYTQPNVVLQNDGPMLEPEARRYSGLPVGHHAGWADAFHAVIADIYDWVHTPSTQPPTICTFADGYRNACIVDAMLRSHALGGVWQPVIDSYPVAEMPILTSRNRTQATAMGVTK